MTERHAFLSTGRGGHSADPDARCPHCGEPSGTHQGVDLTPPGSWFPMRAVVCDPPAAPLLCSTCGAPTASDACLEQHP